METLHQIAEDCHSVEPQGEEDHLLEETREEKEEEDLCTDTLFLEEDKHRKLATANL